MAFNGAGQFNRIYNWTADAANAIPILASRMDTEDSGFATGLSNCICKDGQSTITADIPFSNHKITGLGDATATQDALNQRTGDARYAPLNYRAYKAALTNRNLTVTLTNDPDLQIAIPVAGTYRISALLIMYQAAAGGGIKAVLAYTGTGLPTSFTGMILNQLGGSLSSVGASAVGDVFIASSSVTTSTTLPDFSRIETIVTLTSSGTLSIQWCQNSNNSGNSTIAANSYLIVEKVA